MRADLSFLEKVKNARRRLMVFTERDMLEFCQRQVARGRMPATVEFFHAEIPSDLRTALISAKQKAKDEVLPKALEQHKRDGGWNGQSMKLHPHVITDAKNNPVAVVLPYDEFEQLLDDAEDEWLARMTEEAIAEGGEGMEANAFFDALRKERLNASRNHTTKRATSAAKTVPRVVVDQIEPHVKALAETPDLWVVKS